MTAAANISNRSLKEDIREYWSEKAAVFDQSAGHRIDDQIEAPEWRKLLTGALGDLTGKRVLDLGCGTGEMSRLLLSLGASVKAIDFAEPMLEIARQKNAQDGHNFRAELSDVEELPLEATGTYDAIIARHLVWTLTDPYIAFKNWHRVLRPGGKLLVIDGNWVRLPWYGGMLHSIANRLRVDKNARDLNENDAHARIIAEVFYGAGLTFDALARDIASHAFEEIKTHSLRRIYWLGMRHASVGEQLKLKSWRRFALSAVAG
ncbi:class I SAM-dependent methyltransferase [Nitratireductor aquibiodomus]|uniref:class I SAM-dependent methyltransferase n=1 Tax=Nitratireductor aquibiodomus TaxID=204799 RepID=UPI00046905A7|nr:class I SAM-dependent methyltransferase [Nitratireductor aquibiodomus]